MLPTGISVTDIPENGSKGFICNGIKYFAIKTSANIYLYKNSCPHLGVALEWVEDQFLDSSCTMIQCANHGALFIIENGKCVAGPCSGQKLQAVSFHVVNDDIYLI